MDIEKSREKKYSPNDSNNKSYYSIFASFGGHILSLQYCAEFLEITLFRLLADCKQID